MWAARSISPKATLLATGLAARVGWWPVALFVPLFAGMPYISLELGAFVVGPVLLMAARNLERVWLATTVGEDEYHALLLRAARLKRLPFAVTGSLGAGLLIAILGRSLMWLSLNGAEDWSYWIGYGICVYGPIQALAASLFLIRLHRSVRATPDSA